MADGKAMKTEAATRKGRALSWKNWLAGEVSGYQGGARLPSKHAFQWVRGMAGWVKSPIGWQNQNDAVPDDDGGCSRGPDLVDASAGFDATELDHATTWRPLQDDRSAPLCDQADVEAEADTWARLWLEDHGYPCCIDPSGTPPLVPLMPWALRRAALTFPAGTGLGSDNIAPRALCRLSDAAVGALCKLLAAMELLGNWAAAWRIVLIVLLPKPDGGRRPIGLFPMILRLWMRARCYAARAWEAAHARPCIYGGAGMGAQRAAWQVAFRAENAALMQEQYAQALLDLVKAFEKVPHHLVYRAARKHGYNLWLLRLSIAAYRLPRTVGIEAVYSRLIVAVCGITAGSGFATTELRILLLDVIDSTCRLA